MCGGSFISFPFRDKVEADEPQDQEGRVHQTIRETSPQSPWSSRLAAPPRPFRTSPDT